VDDASLLTLAATQHGVVSDPQATALGYSAQAIRRRIRSGGWRRVLPGVIRCTEAPNSGRQAAFAACIWAGPDAVVSHETAALLWGLDGVNTRRVEITVPRGLGKRSELVSVHSSGRLEPIDRTRVGNIPITTATRTLIDVAGSASPQTLELAMEDAFRRGLTSSPRALARRLDQIGGAGRAGAAKPARQRRQSAQPAPGRRLGALDRHRNHVAARSAGHRRRGRASMADQRTRSCDENVRRANGISA
jgi:predicted transcriptional regulator of viral defense system